MAVAAYPVNLSIDYPDQVLSRLMTFSRLFTVIPIAVILGLLTSGAPGRQQDGHVTCQIAAPGIVFLETILMLLFRHMRPGDRLRQAPCSG